MLESYQCTDLNLQYGEKKIRVCSQQYLSRGVSIFSFERKFFIFEPVPLRPCQKWWCLDELLRDQFFIGEEKLGEKGGRGDHY